MKLPRITILIVTFNNEKTLLNCLQSIQKQDYPKPLIEYLNVDGGSTDSSIMIMKKFGFKVVTSPIKRNAEAQRAIGLRLAKNKLIVSLDADNYLPNKNWLKEMVRPFLEHPNLVHAGTLHYTYRREDTLFNRYCALFGAADPVVYYLGRPDRLSWMDEKWRLGERVEDKGSYFLVIFSEKTLPTVGCNGVVYRKDLLLKHAQNKPHQFAHIDVFVDLIRKGYHQFAVVKNDILHDTAYSFKNLLRKRMLFLSEYYFKQNIKRRYKIYDPAKVSDNLKLFLFIVYTLTVIKPLADSFRGYLRIRDLAWFLHPFVCFVYLFAYGQVSLKHLFLRR